MVLPPINRTQHNTYTTTTQRRRNINISTRSYYYIPRGTRNYTGRMGELPAIADKYTKPKVVLFYKNGDRTFRGYHVTVTPRRFKNFDNLLSELTRVTNLPQGARFIFTPESGKRIITLDELSDGKSYVCGSHPKLKKINYGCAPDGSKRKLTSRNFIPAHATTKLNLENDKAPINVKPKIITVIRNGYSRPRKCVKILLNKRTAQSYDQVLNDVTSAVGVDGGSGVRKLYNVDGKPVLSLVELFGNDDVFIAVGNEKFRSSDMETILEDFGINKSSMRNKPGSRTLAITSPLPTRLSPKSQKKSTPKKKKKSSVKDDWSETQSLASMKRQPLPEIKSRNSDLDNIKSTQNSTEVDYETYEHVILDEPKLDQDENNNTDLENKNKTRNNQESERPNSTDSRKSSPKDDLASTTEFKDSDSESSSSDNISIQNTVSSTNELLPVSNKIEPSAPPLSPEPERLQKVYEKLSVILNNSDEIHDKYTISDKLGDGNFAIVKIGTDKLTGAKFAVKIIDAAKIEGKEALLKNEIKIQRDCAHPNIVQLYHDFHSPTDIFLVMDLVTGGDFFDLVATNIKFEEDEAVNYVRDLCSGLDYLHQRNIVHRDIKPENLMVSESSSGQRILQLADFGLAMKVIQPIFTICGTPTYVSPEILTEKGYGLEVDMWAAGVIIYIMLCGFPPFRSPSRNQTELFDLIEAGEFEFLEPYWDDISDLAKDLISKILVVDVEVRIKARDVFEHPWLKKYNLSRNNTMEEVKSNKNPMSFKTVATGIHAIQRMKLLLDSKIDRNEHFITHVPLHHNTSDSES